MSMEFIIPLWKDLNADNFLAWTAFIIIKVFLMVLFYFVLYRTQQE